MKHNVPIQSLIDHIKTATDVDPWAKEMAEELLKVHEPIPPYRVNTDYQQHWKCGRCSTVIKPEDKFCCACGKRIDWERAVK